LRYIIDTHVIIWFYESNPKLSSKALAMLLDPMNTFLVSPASFWEIAIKLSTGVSLFTEPFLDFIQHSIFDNGFEVLPFNPRIVIR